MDLRQASLSGRPSEQSIWFRDRDVDTATQTALHNVDKIESTHSSFRQQVYKLLGRDSPQTHVETKEELIAQLESLSAEDLGKQVAVEIHEAGQKLQDYTQARKTGAKRVGHQLQQFIKTFADFVGAYSGIVGLVKNAGAPYGQIAYETLSLLLIVVVNKSMNDKKIGDLLRSLTLAFPRLDVLMTIYPSPSLEACVASVYIEVIVFAREATRYYGSRKARALGALTKPPSTNIDIKTGEIRDKLAEVSGEAMVQLHARNKEISENVKALRDENAVLMERATDLQASASRLETSNAQLHLENATLSQQLREQADAAKEHRLDRLRDALGLPEDFRQQANIDIEAVFEVLRDTFPGCSEVPDLPRFQGLRHANHYQHMSRETILTDRQFESWFQAQHSSMLFVCGRTEREGRAQLQSTVSWLSPAAVFVARHIRSEVRHLNIPNETAPHRPGTSILHPDSVSARGDDQDLCIFYSCHPGPRAAGVWNHDSTLPFGIILWSICEWSVTPLHHAEDLRNLAEQAKKETGRDNPAVIKSLTTLIINLVKILPEKDRAIWIILDRMDQCDVKLPHLMNQLTRLMSCGGPKMKILVVADAGYNGEQWEASDLSRDVKDHVIFRDQWNQQRTTGAERILARMGKR